ncbi:unnamed protein product [Musa acuminata subsp. malaccensis]|uniref:(wild Malaysian banana) hypothetical protein n=1 Tax=Musa acuminata subsp. malaccensis TaxID=214687 RepID=A0A804IWA9_MUSAM|nr:unnamed protein product [Musa acuminata subsp. malaccensis]
MRRLSAIASIRSDRARTPSSTEAGVSHGCGRRQRRQRRKRAGRPSCRRTTPAEPVHDEGLRRAALRFLLPPHEAVAGQGARLCRGCRRYPLRDRRLRFLRCVPPLPPPHSQRPLRSTAASSDPSCSLF